MTIAKYLSGLEGVGKVDQSERKPSEETLGWIRAIKDIDRNALMHARKSLDLDDAIRLFNVVTGTMISMLKEIPTTDAANISERTRRAIFFSIRYS